MYKKIVLFITFVICFVSGSFIPHDKMLSVLRFVPQCPLRLWTTLPCPTCGLGRSLVYFWSGRWVKAWNTHFLAPFVFLAVLLYLFSFAVGVKKETLMKLSLPRPVLFFFVLVYVFWGILRVQEYGGT